MSAAVERVGVLHGLLIGSLILAASRPSTWRFKRRAIVIARAADIGEKDADIERRQALERQLTEFTFKQEDLKRQIAVLESSLAQVADSRAASIGQQEELRAKLNELESVQGQELAAANSLKLDVGTKALGGLGVVVVVLVAGFLRLSKQRELADDVEKKSRELKKQVSTLGSGLEKERTVSAIERESLEIQVVQGKQELEKLQTQVAEVEEALKQEQTASTKQRETLEKLIAGGKEQQQKLKAQIVELELALQQEQMTGAEQQEAFAKGKELQKKLQAQVAELEEFQMQVSAAEQNEEKLKLKLVALKQDLEQEKTETMKQQQIIESQVKEGKEKEQKFQMEVAALKATLEKQVAEADKAQEAGQALQKQLEKRVALLEEVLRQERGEAKRQEQDLRMELENTRLQNLSLEAAVEVKEQRLITQAEVSDNIRFELELEIKKLRLQVATQLEAGTKFQEQIEQLKSSYEVACDRLEQVENQDFETRKDRTQILQELELRDKRVAKLEEQLAEARSFRSSLRSAWGALKTGLSRRVGRRR